MKNKKEDEENSINSETFENEEKSIQNKINNFCKLNMIALTKIEMNNDKESNFNGN